MLFPLEVCEAETLTAVLKSPRRRVVNGNRVYKDRKIEQPGLVWSGLVRDESDESGQGSPMDKNQDHRTIGR